MDHRLELERRGRDPAKVKELTLDNCRPADNLNGISAKLADFVNLEELRMINTGLSTLKGFPRLVQLRKLDISDNRLTGGLNYIAEACPNLCALNMGGNRIKDLDTLEPLKQLKSLRHLDMFNCDINTLEDYRNKLFQYLPQVVDLDAFDRNNQEVDPSDDDEDEEEDPEGNNSDEENRENGFGEDNDDSDLESTDSEVSDEDEPVENANGLSNNHNGVLIPPRQPFEGADDFEGSSTESEEESDGDAGEDDDEADDSEDVSNERAPSPPHARGLKRPHADDENSEEENAEDGSPDLVP